MLILAVDEASNLLSTNESNSERTASRIQGIADIGNNGFRDMRKVLRALGRLWPELFAVFTDTASSINVLAENARSDPSLRSFSKPNTSQHPAGAVYDVSSNLSTLMPSKFSNPELAS